MFNDDKYNRNVGQGNKKVGSKNDFLNEIKDRKKKDEEKLMKDQSMKKITDFFLKL